MFLNRFSLSVLWNVLVFLNHFLCLCLRSCSLWYTGILRYITWCIHTPLGIDTDRRNIQFYSYVQASSRAQSIRKVKYRLVAGFNPFFYFGCRNFKFVIEWFIYCFSSSKTWLRATFLRKKN